MMKHVKYRTILFYKDYFEVFFNRQSERVKEKIIWTLSVIEEPEKIPANYLKHLTYTDCLYEIRVQQAGDIFRIFCFFDEGRVIVLANGFQKKTQQTPQAEIRKALKIKHAYEKEKK